MLFQRTILICALTLIFSTLLSYAEVGAENSNATQAAKPGLWQRFTDMAQTWNNSPNHDLYIPAVIWHNRWAYDDEYLNRYNERPWGGVVTAFAASTAMGRLARHLSDGV